MFWCCKFSRNMLFSESSGFSSLLIAKSFLAASPYQNDTKTFSSLAQQTSQFCKFEVVWVFRSEPEMSSFVSLRESLVFYLANQLLCYNFKGNGITRFYKISQKFKKISISIDFVLSFSNALMFESLRVPILWNFGFGATFFGWIFCERNLVIKRILAFADTSGDFSKWVFLIPWLPNYLICSYM